MGAPTAQEFFGADQTAASPGALPSAEQFFASTDPQSGAAHDTIWSSIQSAGARILNHVGYGAQDNWGARPLGLDPETEGALRKAGIFNDYQEGHDTLLKSANEALIRPAAMFADLLARTPAAVLGGISGAATQTAEEIQGEQGAQGVPGVRGLLAKPFGIAGEAAEEIAGGALGEAPALAEAGRVPEVAGAERATEAARARSAGVVGEGEAGYYGAEPLTPENVAARADAAKDAGITPPAPLPPAPDIHELARRIDPDTFEQFDALAAERDLHRETLTRLGAEREASPEALQAKDEIDEIIGGGSEAERESRIDAVRASAPEAVVKRLDDAQARLEAALTVETPEMLEARNRLLDADFGMRDLAPQVSAAYRSAQEIAPNLPEAAQLAEPEGAAHPAAPEEEVPGNVNGIGEPVEAEGAPHVVPEVAAGEADAEAGAAPASVTDGEKLGAGAQVAETSQRTPTARYGNLRAIEGTGEVQSRSLSEGVEAKAIEDGLTATFGDLPEYRQLSMADQAAKARELIDADYETAKAVALGDRQPPKGLLPESVFVGVEKRALAEGDVETLRQLATRSRLSTAATTMGQRIRTLGERDPASPVGAILDVQKAREADLAKRMDIEAAKTEVVAEIKAEIHKAASKADAWRAFLSGLECS